ncbi:hypothetical protein NC653_038176 [Populus alba x Populus x berolinensis]|uniref:Uncharacterized protein n=2 Tax=Populus alba x Populus x berolinensis TaxID=444605 RepID=A0AAD6PSX5_9ROSI|nr:hypothetical protein NC653_038176 [Populus alba x Populus x berolinensis]
MHLINHDPVEEEIVWMRNSLVEVISEVTDLPIIYWNVTSFNRILLTYGRVIDKISFQYNILGHINILIGTRQSQFIKKSEIISIQELDPLHFLVLEANEYKLKAFNLMLEEEDDETQSSSDGTPKAVSVAIGEADKTKLSSDGTPKVVSVKRDETRMCNKNVVNEELVELKQSIQLPPNGY